MDFELKGRVLCPCCGYPTLEEKAMFEICRLCNWEDDGQGDSDADEVRGGPNADYSLTEARDNFKKYYEMYSPGREQGLVSFNKAEEIEVKKELIQTFDQLKINQGNKQELWQEVYKLESKLDAILERTIEEYEKSLVD